MPDDSSSDAQENGRSFWSGLRTLLFGEEGETSLRDQLEEAIENHEGEVPRAGALSPVERQRHRNLLQFGERTAGDIAVPRGAIIAVQSTTAFAGIGNALAAAAHHHL